MKSFGAYLCQRTQMKAGSSSPKLEKRFQSTRVETASLPGGKMGKTRRGARHPDAERAVNTAHLPPRPASPTRGPKGLHYGSPGCSPSQRAAELRSQGSLGGHGKQPRSFSFLGAVLSPPRSPPSPPPRAADLQAACCKPDQYCKSIF